MPSRRTSRTGVPTWAAAPLALTAYAGTAAVALILDPRGSLLAPWWAAAVPPVVYAVVVAGIIRRFSVRRLLVGTGALCAAYGLLLAGTAAVVAVVTPDIRPRLWSVTLGLLALICAPFVLAPLRSLLQPPPRFSRRPVPTAAASRAPAPPKAPVAAPAPPTLRPPLPAAAPPRPWPAPTPRPGLSQNASSAGRPVMKPSVPAPMAPPPPPPAPPPPPPRPKPPAVIAPPPPPPASPTPPEPAPMPPGPMPPAPASIPATRAAEPMEEVIRIPFTRVAEQLPAEVFKYPRESVGANLLEADHLLIPERLVRPQLADGHVQVGWPIIAEQFPRDALALSDEEIVRRLTNGALVLPLDEVVRQVPPGIFSLSAPSLDVRALENFPPPFQPYLPAPSSPEPGPTIGDQASEPPAPTAEAVPAEAAAMEAAPIEPMAEAPPLGAEPIPGAPEPPVVDAEPTPGTLELAPPAPEPAPALESTLLPAPDPPLALEPPRLATELPPTSAAPPSDDASRVADARRITALLGPLLSPVTVGSCQRSGSTFLTLTPPAVAGSMVADVAAQVLPFLTDARLPEPALQATVRGTAMTVVVTPLAGAPGSALAAATATAAPLALLERLCLRAAAVPVAPGRPPALVPAPSPDADLLDAPAEPTVRAVAESLRAFGAVTPSVLRDPEGTLVVYMFLPRGLEARALGGFARDLHRGLAGSPAGEIASIILKIGPRRLLVRVVEGLRGAVLVAGGGPVDRPGMARLELERAATRLGRL